MSNSRRYRSILPIGKATSVANRKFLCQGHTAASGFAAAGSTAEAIGFSAN
jgi:hypothetical protein